MAIKTQDRLALKGIVAAAKVDELFLAECEDRETGEIVTALCSVLQLDGDRTMMVPLAQCFTSNPFERLKPIKQEAEEDAA